VKPILYLFICITLFSCNPSTDKNNVIHSDATPDSTSEYVLTEEDYEAMRVKASSNYTLAGSVGTGKLLNTPMEDLIRLMYPTDSLLVGDGSSDAQVEFTIDMLLPITANISSIDSTCKEVNLIFLKSATSDETENYKLAQFEKQGNQAMIQSITEFEGGVRSAEMARDISISQENSLTRDCNTLAIVNYSEGGGADFMRTKEITFFVIGPFGLKSILTIQTENTIVEYYESSNKPTSEFRIWKKGSKTTKGYFDVEVSYTKKVNENVIITRTENYVFNGTEYALISK
jgi:hypothetical protein